MSYKTLIYEKDEGVALLKLNRPKTMNALDETMARELEAVTRDLEQDEDIGAVVLTGEGDNFCAGGDLRHLMQGFSPVEGPQYVKSIHPWITGFVNLEKPVISAVNGYAVGAGFCIAMLGDILLAGQKAVFGQLFVQVGLVPDLAGMYLLPRMVGLQRAKELVFTGRQIGAEEAMQMGVVSRVLPDDQLLEESKKLARQLAAGPRVALRQAKRILNMSGNLNLEELLELEAYAQGLCFQTEDFQEGTRAFMEKRKPQFKGK